MVCIDYEALDMLSPFRQRFALFVGVGMAIIDGGNAGDDTAFVVENGLDYMRLDAEHGHIGCHGAAYNSPNVIISQLWMQRIARGFREIFIPYGRFVQVFAGLVQYLALTYGQH